LGRFWLCRGFRRNWFGRYNCNFSKSSFYTLDLLSKILSKLLNFCIFLSIAVWSGQYLLNLFGAVTGKLKAELYLIGIVKSKD
jgi:hypothetical protein